jgi:hypothetical protein
MVLYGIRLVKKYYWVYGRSIQQKNCALVAGIVTECFAPTDTATLQMNLVLLIFRETVFLRFPQKISGGRARPLPLQRTVELQQNALCIGG